MNRVNQGGSLNWLNQRLSYLKLFSIAASSRAHSRRCEVFVDDFVFVNFKKFVNFF